MRNMLFLLALLPLLTLTPACDGSNDVIGRDAPPEAMIYAGFDADGRVAVRGWIKLDLAIVQMVPQPLDFTGSWSLYAVKNDGELGPQIGSGALIGQFVENGVTLNLNPNRADDNVILFGSLTVTGGPVIRMSYEGTWSWETISGPRSSGTFRAATP